MAISDPNINEPVQAAQAQKAATPGFLQGQQNQSNDYLGRFSSFVNKLPTTQQMSDQFSGELNLPQLRNNANSIQSTIANLPGTYSQAVRGTDVNANQLQRIIAQKQGELAPAATTANNALASAEGQLNQRIGYGQADRALQTMPYQSEQQLMSEQQARATSLYSQDNQHELDTLINKMNAGITLSEGEKNRANALATAEMNFEHQKQLNSQQAQLGSSGRPADTSYQTIGGRVKLIDNATGRVVADLGNSGSGGGSANPYALYGGGTNSVPSYAVPRS